MNLDHLRLSVGLAHTLSGSSLLLRCRGEDLVASDSEHADITLCLLRKVVLASRLPCQPNYLRQVTSARFGNGAVDLGHGVVFHEASGSYWFGSFLAPGCVVELAAGVIGADCSFSVRPDPGLGVSLVSFGRSRSIPPWRRYQMVSTVHERCLHRELERSIERAERTHTLDVAG